ncbi:MAG: hypothetical protein KDD53_11775 [Bdellovibrionales bacterium]|nr:hypothetical protein [Bdellovibrionales bacterium]
MSIDWLFDIERDLDNGKEILACPGVAQNDWVVGKPLDELRRVGKRTASSKKISVNIVKLIPKLDTVAGDLYLVPTRIGDPGGRGEPQVKWSVVDTREAAEMMRDLRHGPAPFFGMEVLESVDPVED